MSYCYTYVDFHGSSQIRGRRNAVLGQSHFQYNIYMKIQKMQQSHSLATHEETTCSNGNVTRNRGGNRLEGKHTLMFVKL